MDKISISSFGETPSDQEVKIFNLQNKNGMQVSLLNFGCVVKSIQIPVAEKLINVVLGYDTLEEYLKGTSCIGAFVGRYANRIGNSSFVLNGKKYCMVPNEGKNHLHGDLGTKVYDAEVNHDSNSVTFSYISPNGEDSMPGNLNVKVKYSLSEDNTLSIHYFAVSDKNTVLNFTNHSYFNLNGDGQSIFKHKLWLNCDSYTQTDAENIPTGKLISVDGTPMDFRKGKEIGQDIFSDYVLPTLGFDSNFVINSPNGQNAPCATALGDISGIKLECFTDQPGIQLYTGNFLDCDATGKFKKYQAFCLETQHYPDSPNHPEFPSTVLHAGKEFNSTTMYRFSI